MKKEYRLLMVLGAVTLLAACGKSNNSSKPTKPTSSKGGETSSVIENVSSSKEEAPHEHKFDGEGQIKTDPGCEKAGVMVYTCECGLQKTEPIPATGHKYGVTGKCTNKGCLENISGVDDFADVGGTLELQVADHKAYIEFETQCSVGYYFNEQSYELDAMDTTGDKRIIKGIHIYKENNLTVDLAPTFSNKAECFDGQDGTYYWEYWSEGCELEINTKYYVVFDIAESFTEKKVAITTMNVYAHDEGAPANVWFDTLDGTARYMNGCPNCDGEHQFMGYRKEEYIKIPDMKTIFLNEGMKIGDIKKVIKNKVGMGVELSFDSVYYMQDDTAVQMNDTSVIQNNVQFRMRMQFDLRKGFAFKYNDSMTGMQEGYGESSYTMWGTPTEETLKIDVPFMLSI